jgi:serine/threonine-protein kinase
VDEAVSLARQIAEALDAAHHQGVVHRDLKPANIKVRGDGTVKVLDFGLAKLTEPPGAGARVRGDSSRSPTITSPALGTGIGVLIGTAAYMSPEQAKGKPADKRSDIWAFGCVLYEMLTGRRAFAGDDVSETIAAVLKTEPDWAALPAEPSSPLRILLRRCLMKDPAKRIADAAVVRFVLEEQAHLDATGALSPGRTLTSRRRVALAAAAGVALGIAITAGLVRSWWPEPVERPITQFELPLPDNARFLATCCHVMALSSDGTHLAYTSNSGLLVRRLAALDTTTILPPSTVALEPVISPDATAVAFFVLAEGVLKRVPITGGAAVPITSKIAAPFGMTWSSGAILAGQGAAGIVRIPENGGEPETIITVSENELAHGPQLLPDGEHVLFTLARNAGPERWDEAAVVVQSIGSSERVTVAKGTDGRYVPTGHVVYASRGTLFAVPFDASTRRVTGNAVPVLAGVRRADGPTGGTTGAAQFAISDTGSLVYVPGPVDPSVAARSLVHVDSNGKSVTLPIAPGAYVRPKVSRDGTRIAFGRDDGNSADVFVYNLDGRRAEQRITFDGTARYPVWSPDGTQLAVQMGGNDGAAVVLLSSDGRGGRRQITQPNPGERHVPESWSPDGAHLLFSVESGSDSSLEHRLWVHEFRTNTARPYGDVPPSRDPIAPAFSADGRWVAYTFNDVDESRAAITRSTNRGVFVTPFPPVAGERYQLPKVAFDYHPAWTPDGRRIIYVPSSTRTMVSVDVSTQREVTFGKPVDVPWAPLPGHVSTDTAGYDVLPDGGFISLVGSQQGAPGFLARMRIVLNWSEELRRLAPASGL